MNYQGHDNPEQEVATLLEKAGWTVSPDPSADFIIKKDDLIYAVEVKRASEGRADRLIPLISQSVLEARIAAQHIPHAAPLVVVVGKNIPRRVAEQVKGFMRTYAPDVAVGVIDSRGLREFLGAGLETLTRPPSGATTFSFVAPKSVHLFSDLSQWLLKVLLAADLDDERLLNAPLVRYRNASELARGANVSVMTAFRFVEELRSNGYLHESSEVIRLVRLDELIVLWKAATARRGVSIGARWLFAGEKKSQIARVSQVLGEEACVALYAAADALGFGIAQGVPTHFYVRRRPDQFDQSLGLVRVEERSEAQVFFHVPNARESVFRGAVNANGIRSCDVLQAWLDVGHDASRGNDQAEHLYRRVIGPMFMRASQW